MDLRYAIGAALAAGALVTASASAADNSDWRARVDQEFTRLDKNDDGNIDKTEAQARPRLRENFGKYDMDNNGLLGKDEFAAAMNGLRSAQNDGRGKGDWRATLDDRFTRIDKNNDGNIDTTEAQARPWLKRNFSKYDTDHNGKIGKDEFAAAVSAERTARANTQSAAGGTRPAPRTFNSLDTNNDGAIDKTEAKAWGWLERNFNQYDSDHDRKLGKDEFAAALNASPRR